MIYKINSFDQASVMKIMIGLFLCAIFAIAGLAQPKAGVSNQGHSDAQITAELNKSVVGRLLDNNVQAREKGKWNLKSVYYNTQGGLMAGDGLNFVYLVFTDQKDELSVQISEYKSIEGARIPLTGPISQGAIKDYKNYGDEGRKIYGFYQGFSSLGFRKGKFYISVNCQGREEIADRFAGYADSAIENQ